MSVLKWLARRSNEPGRLASGLRLVCDRGRGPSGGFAGFGATRPSLWEVELPEGKRVASSPTLGLGHFSPRLPGSATFPTRARY